MGQFSLLEIWAKRLPLVEGKCPPEFDPKTGEWYYPEEQDYDDPELVETDTYTVEDKEEFYGYVTVCHVCGTRFQAVSDDGEDVRKYCPGCGAEL